jgi:hypothetical protein
VIPLRLLYLDIATAFTVVFCIGAALSYWAHEPDEVKQMGQAALKLILGVVAYPLTVASIILIHISSCVMTILRYTGGRVTGEQIEKIALKVTFD